VDELTFRRKRNNCACVYDALDVEWTNFAILAADGDDAVGIERLHMLARHADERVRDVDAGHSFGCFHSRFDGFYGFFEIGDDALT